MTRRPSRTRSISIEELRGKRVRAYVRESTERQARADRFGPDTQRHGIRAFCERHGLNLPEREYFDASSGRTVDRRPQLQQSLLDAGEYDVLLFFHSSRSFRNRQDAAIWKQQFARAGITLVFTEQGLISGDPRSKLAEGFHELIDEQRSDEQGMLIAGGLRAKFARGLVNGTAPLGYQRVYTAPGDPRNSELEVDPAGAKTVRAIVDLYLGGQMSFAAIAEHLNALGHRGKRGLLTKGSVEEVLRNKTYTGVTVWHPGTPEEEERPGLHAPLITADEFQRIEAIRGERTRWNGRRPARRAYPLSRRAMCYFCGGSFFGDTGGKKASRRYRHRTDRRCANRGSFAADALEQQFGAFLEERLDLPDDFRVEVQRLTRQPHPEEDDGQRVRIEGALSRLKQLYKWGDIGDREYHEQREELKRSTAALSPVNEPVSLERAARSAELFQKIRSWWRHPGFGDDERRELVNEVFEQIQLDERGLRAVRLREEYQPLAAAAQQRWVVLVGETGFEPATS